MKSVESLHSEMPMGTWNGVPHTDARRCFNCRRLCRFFGQVTNPLLVEVVGSGWCGICMRAYVRWKWYRTCFHLGRAANLPYIFSNPLYWSEVATMLCGTELGLMRVVQVKIWMEVLKGRRYRTLTGDVRDAEFVNMFLSSSDEESDMDQVYNGLYHPRQYPNPMWTLWGLCLPSTSTRGHLAPVYDQGFYDWNCYYRQLWNYGVSVGPRLIHVVIAFLGNFHDFEETGWPLVVASTGMSSVGCRFRWG